MRRVWIALLVAGACASLSAAPKFLDVWKSPEVSRLDFKGKTVAALVITDSQSLQMSGEEALTRELMAHGVTGLATYRFVPGPELKSPDKAKGWFERRSVQGVVAIRPLKQQTDKYAPVVFTSGYYQSLWGYYGYGWNNTYVPIGSRTTTTVVVETLVYDATRDQLVWAATSATKDPDSLQDFVKDLVDGVVREMKKMKMVG
jgi:hypothetical protein